MHPGVCLPCMVQEPQGQNRVEEREAHNLNVESAGAQVHPSIERSAQEGQSRQKHAYTKAVNLITG